MKNGEQNVDIQGLNTVKYKLVSITKRPLYTKFLVYYNQTEIQNGTSNK
jgi:hypothetical protein